MRRLVLAAGIAMLVVASCSKPTELASEANAKYDRRDPVVAPPAVGEEVDTAPVAPEPGSEEAEALPGEAGVAPADEAPVDGSAPAIEPPPLIEIPPDLPSPPIETVEPIPDQPRAPAAPPAETPPAETPAPAPN